MYMGKIIDDCAKALSENMKTLRARLGWTQADLAEQSRLSLSAIRQFENNTRWPRPENITAMARALGIHYSELFNGSPSRKPTVQEALNIITDALGMEKKIDLGKQTGFKYRKDILALI